MGRSTAAMLAAADPLLELRELLLGPGQALHELPALPDLIAAAIALASGARKKLLLAFSNAPAELALVRQAELVRLDCYGTESTPEIFVRGREIALRTLLDACARSCRRVAEASPDALRSAALVQLAQRAHKTAVVDDAHAQLRAQRVSGGSLESPGRNVKLAFGFDAEIPPAFDHTQAVHAFADVHALLFHGALYAFVGERRLAVFEGPIMLAAQRMVDAVRALCEAHRADRSLHVRLRSEGFWVSVRRERGGAVSLTLNGGRGDSLSWPALELEQVALPVLRLASDLIRKLIATDRRQSHNLRVAALRAEVRTLRRMIRARHRRESFENADPERLRPPLVEQKPTHENTRASEASTGLRYSERWSVEVDGLDAAAVHLCGERLVVAAQKLTLALNRSGGEVLWSQPSAGATSMMAGRTLVRLLPDGAVELHEVEDGSVIVRTQLSARGALEPGLFVSGHGLPPTALLIEARQHVCAIDLRTGQPRWRFRAHGASGVQLARSGRVLCVTSGDGSVSALDLASGELAWRFSDASRFSLRPALCREVLVAIAGEPRGGTGAAFGIELYTGRLLWRVELPSAPSADPVAAGQLAIVPYGRSRNANLVALDALSGKERWTAPDPGLDNGAHALSVDRALIVNAPSGRALALDLEDGRSLWQRQLSNPLTDDVPRQLEPLLRQGALFVPSAQVHVLKPQDGAALGQIGCDLVPDCLRMDERGSLYVAEESGHLAAYASVPQLRLVK